MLADMLKTKNIQIRERVEDWREAIRLSLKPLIVDGYVEGRYADAIMKSTEQLGPYYVLSEDIALIHGRPEDGVIEKQLAVTLLREPVLFDGCSYPVRLLIALAAEDADSHIDVMKVLSTIFMDKEKIKALIQAEKAEQIYDLLLKEEK